MSPHCPECGAELEAPAIVASRLPQGMGVIWSEHRASPIVYQINSNGSLESARLLGGEFLTPDDHLKYAIARDLVKVNSK